MMLNENKETNSKYNINPEDNIPVEIYGIPDYMLNKYDVKPEDNIPQRVYGIPNTNNVNLKKCPYCGSTNLWKYLYGKPSYNYDKDKYCLGGCIITENQPTHKCKKCKCDIYLDEEYIKVEIKDEENSFLLLLIHNNKSNLYGLVFSDLNNLEDNDISKLRIGISQNKYNEFVDNLNKITNVWKDTYLGDGRFFWNISINLDNTQKNIIGNGDFPDNWNEFIDLLIEYENIFKNNNKMNQEMLRNIENKNLSLKEIVKNKIVDPFFAELVINHFKEEKMPDVVAKIIFKKLSKYDYILNEFTKFLIKKTYDLTDAIEINGYTAKKIHELNPNFPPTGVYTFMELLRTNPEKAQKMIKENFKNKDSVLPKD